jgi:hypothetical protein
LYQGFPNHPGGILVFWMAVLWPLMVLVFRPIPHFKLKWNVPKITTFIEAVSLLLCWPGWDVHGNIVCTSYDYSGSTNDVIAFQDSSFFRLWR